MKKIKPIWWVLIITSGVALIIGLTVLVTRVFSHPARSWWWTGGIAIFFVVVGIIVGVVFLIIKLRMKQPDKIQQDPDDAEERAKYILIYDNDHPDNFIRKDRVIKNVGEAGKDRTPILWLMGEGSETKAKIDILVNLSDAKKYPLFLFNKSDKFVLDIITTYAENPERVEVEERILGRDEMGLPTTIVKTKRMSKAEQKEEEKKQEAEETNAY